MKKRIFALVCIVVLMIFIMTFPVIFQEGNPIPIFRAIIDLHNTNDSIVLISDNPNQYISLTKVGDEPFTDIMMKSGWILDEQLGSGYIFYKGEETLIVTSVQYTGRYRIWKIPE